MPEKKLPDPAAGGRYERNPDGSLTQVHKTEEAPMRDKRERDEADTTEQQPAGDTTEQQPAGDTVRTTSQEQ